MKPTPDSILINEFGMSYNLHRDVYNACTQIVAGWFPSGLCELWTNKEPREQEYMEYKVDGPVYLQHIHYVLCME